jgi:hypothetical protein
MPSHDESRVRSPFHVVRDGALAEKRCKSLDDDAPLRVTDGLTVMMVAARSQRASASAQTGGKR